MDRRKDDGFEVLGLGEPVGTLGRGPAGALPPLELDTGGRQPAYAEPGGQARWWQRWVTVLVVFIVGVVTGAYVSNARTDSAGLAAEAAEASLVAGPVAGGFEPTRDTHRVTVPVLNAGPRDVAVLSAYLPRWAAPASRPPREVTIPAGEWVDVTAVVQPVCDAPVPTHLGAEVRTDAGETSVSVPLPPEQHLLEAIARSQCAEHAQEAYIVPERLDFSEAEPGTRRMATRIWAWWEAAEVVDVGTSAPGFEATAVDLPVRTGTGGLIELELDWRITDCTATESLSEVDLQLGFTSDGDVVRLAASLPNWALARLARFAAEECGV